MSEKISKQEAIDAIKGMFSLVEFEKRKPGLSFYMEKNGNADFFFDKQQYEREEVVDNLRRYFMEKDIEGGMCKIDAITLVWTHVSVIDRIKNNND